MSEPLVVTALVDKRARIAGQIAELERQIVGHRAALAHVDAVLRLFDPDAKPEAIAPKGQQHNSTYFVPGDVTGMCLACIREADGGAVSSREIALRLMTSKRMDETDAKLRDHVQTSARNALMALRRRGVVESVGAGWDTRWRLAEPQ